MPSFWPWTNLHELNLDWIVQSIKDQETRLTNFVSLNSIKYADPFQWTITSQYAQNTLVIDPQTGTAYLSVQPVPQGVQLNNTDYWTPVFTLQNFIDPLKEAICRSIPQQENGQAATQDIPANSLFFVGNALCTNSATIPVTSLVIIGSNCTQVSVEELLAAERQAREQADTQLGQQIADETDARQQADTQLGQQIADETDARQQADEQLQQNITAEQTAREQADEQLGQQIVQVGKNIPNTADFSSRRIIRGFRKSNYDPSPDTGYQMQGMTNDDSFWYIGFSGSTSTSTICKINRETGSIVTSVDVPNSHVNCLDIYNGTLYCASANNTSEIIKLNAQDLSIISRKSITGLSAIAGVSVDTDGTLYAGGVQIIYKIHETDSAYTIDGQFDTGVDWNRTTQTILVRNGRYYGLMFQPDCIVSGNVGDKYDTLYNIPAWIENIFQMGEPEDITLDSDGNIILGSWTLLCPRSEVALWQISVLGTKVSVPQRVLKDAQIPAVLNVNVDTEDRADADGFNTPFRYISEALLSCKSPLYKQASGIAVNVAAGDYDSIVAYGLSNIEILCTAPCTTGQFIVNVCDNITLSGARLTRKTTWASYTQMYRLYRCGYMTLSQVRFVNQHANINYITVQNSILHWTSWLHDGDSDIQNGVDEGTVLNVAGSNVYLDFDVPYPLRIDANSFCNRAIPLATETQISQGAVLAARNNTITAQAIARAAKRIRFNIKLFGNQQVVETNLDSSNNACFIMSNIGNTSPYTLNTYETVINFQNNTMTVTRCVVNETGTVDSPSANIVISSVEAIF